MCQVSIGIRPGVAYKGWPFTSLCPVGLLPFNLFLPSELSIFLSVLIYLRARDLVRGSCAEHSYHSFSLTKPLL